VGFDLEEFEQAIAQADSQDQEFAEFQAAKRKQAEAEERAEGYAIGQRWLEEDRARGTVTPVPPQQTFEEARAALLAEADAAYRADSDDTKTQEDIRYRLTELERGREPLKVAGQIFRNNEERQQADATRAAQEHSWLVRDAGKTVDAAIEAAEKRAREIGKQDFGRPMTEEKRKAIAAAWDEVNEMHKRRDKDIAKETARLKKTPVESEVPEKPVYTQADIEKLGRTDPKRLRQIIESGTPVRWTNEQAKGILQT
jgi:hypothetical protein